MTQWAVRADRFLGFIELTDISFRSGVNSLLAIAILPHMSIRLKKILSIIPLLLTCFASGIQAQSFLPARVFSISSPVNPGPESIEAADLDEDGNLDLVTADNGFITILFGDGTGDFPRYHSIATQVGFATTETGLLDNEYAALTDFDHDGHIDILVAHSASSSSSLGNSIMIFLNDPSALGNFPNPAIKITDGMGANPSAIRMGQFNPLIDNLQDLALTLFLNPRLRIYTGTPAGGLTSGYSTMLLAQSAAESLDVGDFNEDGKQDIALVDRLRVWVLFSDGNGQFSTSINLSTGDSGAHLEYDVLMRDMDGDTHLDLVVANGGIFNTLTSTANSLVVLYGNGTASTPTVTTSLDLGEEVTKVGAADFDGDGILDIAAALVGQAGNGKVAVVRNRAEFHRRSYDLASQVVLDASGWTTMCLVTDDFNKDGRVDLAVGNEGHMPSSKAGNVSVFLNALEPVVTPTPTLSPTYFPTMTQTPSRTMTPTRTQTPTVTPTPLPTRVPDINEDGRVDSLDLQILLEQMGNVTGP